MPDEAVDEEVGRRVEGEEGVGDWRDAIADGVAVQLDRRQKLLEGDGDAQRHVGKFAGDEDAHDDDEGQSDVLALLVAARQIAMSAPHLPQSADQAGVEPDQQKQRPDRPEHEVADGFVDDEVPQVPMSRKNQLLSGG